MIKHYDDGKTEIVAIERAKPGNRCCGDANEVIHTDEYTLCVVADGLGSGEGAKQSANIVIDTIQSMHAKPVEEMASACNDALVNKRGAVITIVKIHYVKKEITYCNFGNIGFLMCSPNGQIFQPMPARGYLSGRKQRLTSNRVPYESGTVFFIYSDGIESPLNKKELLTIRFPEQASEILEEKIEHARDDVTALLGKLK
ncbi:SpoIIE family protein phosphatase [Bacillus suaedae]|uniref:SpoIIE family protein phosphatase n=1 Tax=Halalkalibacter suaedae TaxID=2822140 RepID=A0A940WX40_9BACI|nr:SpoIIE family protein phosphatase [Bacillus suaedae]MBP3953303.1 SpoIIE family protein phosphatase [Bacillus suaedae]